MSSTAAETGLGRIHQIAIPVRDVGTSLKFYRDVLGLRFLFEAPNVAFFDCNGIRLMLGSSGEPEFRPSTSVVYFAVENLVDAAGRLEAKGVKFREAPHVVAILEYREVWLAAVEDPDGNVIGLMAEVPIADEAEGDHPAAG
jgi:methylmalonyl-CoA/ethylmalonyl-CoA epimerase